ncbi:putative B3 domain-containing protein [Vitis vinifera]|uniref:Putative B3 domain-containing protein n=1 Tax=Vitis vinifera TaxID=29760 RepID=A0A438HSQ9_VITVI|nr:putative B3 domain-containing protein [Vitis vinifera]
MKNFVDGIIEHLHDDLENQWNLRMEQNIGVGLDLPRVEMDEGEDPPPELPEDLKVRIREMNGTRPILVLEKQLFKTDINENENRLSMPLNQIRREFLSEDEKMRVVEGMQVKLIQPSLEETTVTFKKWKMKESCHLYVFTREWKLIVNDNSLEARTRIQACAAIIFFSSSSLNPNDSKAQLGIHVPKGPHLDYGAFPECISLDNIDPVLVCEDVVVALSHLPLPDGYYFLNGNRQVAPFISLEHPPLHQELHTPSTHFLDVILQLLRHFRQRVFSAWLPI